MLNGFPELVTEAVGAPCYVADDPIECVAKGVAKAFDYTDELLDGFEKISLYRYKKLKSCGVKIPQDFLFILLRF